MISNIQVKLATKMAAAAAKSTAAFLGVLMVMLVQTAQAHEVRPAIADVTITPTEMTMDMQVNLEAFIAGVDLSATTDTNESAQADDYDALRALSAAALKERFQAYWPQMQAGFNIKAGDATVTPQLVDVDIIEEPDVALLRDSTVRLKAALPAGDTPVTIGWDKKFGPLVMRQIAGGDNAYTAFLRNGEASAAIPRVGTVQESAWAVFSKYVVAGFEHILPLGLDHILFVLGLFFLSSKLKPLLLQVTTFTLAHTITLALGALDIVTIAPEIVEPLIAASIVYVAVENLITSEIKPWRLMIVFAFGLLHGLGFASVLGDFGLSSERFITSLIAFNIGVEFGQLTVIALAFLAVGLWFSHKPWYRRYISNPASIVIGLIGAYWVIERVFL